MSPTPTPAQIRAAAARLVSQTADGGRSLDDLLAGDADEGSARGLKRSLAYGTLRWHFRLVEILARLTERPVDRMQPELRALLEVGLFQLLSGETAEHAAVAETVNAARELGFARGAGFVNAVLRRFQRERAAVLRAVDVDLAVRTAHPRWFVEALQRERPAAAVAILEANNAHPPMWLRVNRQRASVAEYQATLVAAGWQAQRHPQAPDALLIEPAADVRTLPGFAAGQVSVQDAAAQLAVELLAPQPGERILDACAAPGGKTCHILERVGGPCHVTALDVSARAARPGSRESGPSGPERGRAHRRPRRTGGLVGRQGLRPDPARRAVLGDWGHPPAPRHQVAATRERHSAAGAQATRLAARRLEPARTRGHVALHELLGAAGPRTRPSSPSSCGPPPEPRTGRRS